MEDLSAFDRDRFSPEITAIIGTAALRLTYDTAYFQYYTAPLWQDMSHIGVNATGRLVRIFNWRRSFGVLAHDLHSHGFPVRLDRWPDDDTIETYVAYQMHAIDHEHPWLE